MTRGITFVEIIDLCVFDESLLVGPRKEGRVELVLG